jgi:hypothetical protein
MWLYDREGCYEMFPEEAPRLAHIATCVAYRDYVIEEKLRAQRRDDGIEEDEE